MFGARVARKRGVPLRSNPSLAVCVKGLHFPYEDRSGRLSEWMELLALMEAGKVFFYTFNVHPEMEGCARIRVTRRDFFQAYKGVTKTLSITCFSRKLFMYTRRDF